MAEEVKNGGQNESAEPADRVVEDNPAGVAEQGLQRAEGNEKEADIAPGDIKSTEPQDQAFWEDSVDANSVDLSAGETVNAEETPAAGENSQPEAGEQETPSATKEEADSPSTPSLLQEEEKGEGDDQPAEQEPEAAQEAGQEESQTDTEATDTEREEPRAKGNVISFYEYMRKKRLLTGIGILWLVAGSIGYAVVPGLHAPGTITSTLLNGAPESAYNMKFFLPLNVGYEKPQFVKLTIVLELIDDGVQKELDKNLSQVRKEVIDLILTKSPQEVRSTNGKKELSREITKRINKYLSKDCIKDTYFTELVIL